MLIESSAPTRIDLPVDEATVKEYRGEAFGNIGRVLSPTLRMDLGLTAAVSLPYVFEGEERGAASRVHRPARSLDALPVMTWSPTSRPETISVISPSLAPVRTWTACGWPARST